MKPTPALAARFAPRPLARRLGAYLWTQWLRPLAVPLLLVTAAKSALADINYVPSGSMQPTILAGDVVFINTLAYDLRVPFTTARLAQWSDPARGDIVVCFSPQDGQRLVKRVVALPGDTVELRQEVLFIDGVRRDYSALPASAGRHLPAADRSRAKLVRESDPAASRGHAMMVLPGTPALRSFGPVTVPAGHYWVLGDNRDNSHDSRFYGAVPRHEIVGEVKGVFVSADLDRWLAPRFDRFFTALE